MNNLLTEEELEGSGSCLICFNKIEDYDVLSDQDSQKIIKKCWKYLYKNVAKDKLRQTAESIDENQLPLCKKCFDAVSELMQLSEHVKNCEKQISDLSFEFSLGVLARRTHAESLNNKSEDSPKEFVVLDVSKISPSLFSMDQLIPTKTEEFEHPCANSFVDTDAVLDVPQDPLGIVKQEFNEYYYDDNSQTEMLECPQEKTNLIENHLVKADDIQDGVTISNNTRNYLASRSDMGLLNNVSSQIDDSAGCDSSDTNFTQELPICRKPVAMLTRKLDISDELNSMSSPLNPPVKDPLRNKSSKKKSRQPTSSNIILGKTGSGNLKVSGLSLDAHERIDHGQINYKCYFCEKVLSSSWSLERHMRVHTQEKPFRCSVCKKTFSDLSRLKRHKLIHTGERPLKCSFCVKAK